MRVLVALPAFSFVGLLVCSCGAGNAASQLAKPPEFQPKDQTKCGVEKSQARPLIVEWPSADRMELESKVRAGLVVVRYQGCTMDVLERCSVPANYGYRGATIAQDKVVIKDEDDLYANLPVGAAKFEGKLEKSGQLTVDMDLVGRYESPKQTIRADELQGDCAGATHFVYGVTVGAFDFYAGADATVGGGVGVAGVGAGGRSTADRESLTKNGDPAACAKATTDDKAPPQGCGALIRIEVVPLGEAKALPPTCPDGTQWDGSQCVGRKVVTQVDCPQGSHWDGGKCAAAQDRRSLVVNGVHIDPPPYVNVAYPEPALPLAPSGRTTDGYGRAWNAWQAGDLQAAKAGFRADADANGSTRTMALFSLGALLERLGDVVGARNALVAAATDPTLRSIATCEQALLDAGTGHADLAVQELDAAATASPKDKRMLVCRGAVHSIMRDGTTQALLDQADGNGGPTAESSLIRARDYYANQRFSDARNAVNKALQLDPQNGEALMIRGALSQMAEDDSPAIQDFQAAVDRRPSLVRAEVLLGAARIRAGQIDACQRPLESAVRYAPNSAVNHAALAGCYRVQGRSGDAKREYDTALAMDSTFVTAHYGLALLYIYSQNVPGVASPADRRSRASQELDAYRKAGGPIDTSELVNAAQQVQ